MKTLKTSDKIILTVTGTLDNGAVFFEATDDKPITVTIGNSELPPSVETIVSQMQVGESRKVRVPPEEGYGIRQKDLLQVIDNPHMVEKLQPKPGMLLSLNVQKDGRDHAVPATVISVDGSQITVDYNHPLAGHHLTYNLTVIDVIGADA